MPEWFNKLKAPCVVDIEIPENECHFLDSLEEYDSKIWASYTRDGVDYLNMELTLY